MVGDILLVLPYPISANRYWRSFASRGTHRRGAVVTTVSKEAVSYKAAVRACVIERGLRAPLTCRLAMHIDLYPKRPKDWERRAKADPAGWDDTVKCIDLGNAEKVLSDALQGLVYIDDKQIWHQVKRRMVPDGEGRVVVTIRPMIDELELTAHSA